VSLKYNAIPTACETFSYGEVEDYTVNIQAGTADTTPPTAPTSLTATGTTQTTTNLSWTASTDNVAVTGYEVYQDGVLKTTVTTASYAVTGLTAATAYTFSVKAKDSAGNLSARALKCEGADIILQNVATIIRSNKLGNSGGEAIFISTCSPVHGEAGCGCLARLGSAVYPNIYQLQYSHDLMAGIVQGNPIVALQIVGACGIMNY